MIRILLWTIIGDFLVNKYCAYIHNALYYPKRRYKYMQEFDFTNTDMADDLSEMAEHLSQEEATAAIAAIKALRDGRENTEVEDFKNWFDSAFLPILKDFAATTTSKLTVEQDARGDITATFTCRCGFDITANQRRMHMVVSAADHISVNRWSGSNEVEFTLIFGIPEYEE